MLFIGVLSNVQLTVQNYLSCIKQDYSPLQKKKMFTHGLTTKLPIENTKTSDKIVISWSTIFKFCKVCLDL